MAQRRCLRVLIAGQQDKFDHVLATNIQHLGYQVVVVPSVLMAEGMDRYDISGDILLYDLDEPFRRAGIRKGSLVSQQDLLTSDILHTWKWLSERVQLTVVLSSGSVSRTMLERMGAVALLYKPFEMGRLQRYLHVLRRLLLSEEVPLSLEEQEQWLPVLPAEKEKMRVLVVDDDAGMAQAISQSLESVPGFCVAVAHDGLQALEYCLDWQPHCVVTDLIMPWMNGYQVMRCLSLAAIPLQPAFVVISALTRLEKPVRQPYLEGTTVTYVDKPFHIDHLLTTIKQVCAKA